MQGKITETGNEGEEDMSGDEASAGDDSNDNEISEEEHKQVVENARTALRQAQAALKKAKFQHYNSLQDKQEVKNQACNSGFTFCTVPIMCTGPLRPQTYPPPPLSSSQSQTSPAETGVAGRQRKVHHFHKSD
eukprot:1052967-Prorocentrum_minimum.AAC.4